MKTVKQVGTVEEARLFLENSRIKPNIELISEDTFYSDFIPTALVATKKQFYFTNTKLLIYGVTAYQILVARKPERVNYEDLMRLLICAERSIDDHVIIENAEYRQVPDNVVAIYARVDETGTCGWAIKLF